MSVISQLRDYGCWIGESPLEIRRAVGSVGGWNRVFPSSRPFPQWAHRIRNFFNEEPHRLQRLEDYSKEWKKARNVVRYGHYATTGLTLDIYKDENDRYWHEMSTVGTIYHYKGKVNWWKKGRAFFNSQLFIPVFKLISPDGTGGSCEICINNWQRGVFSRGSRKIGATGQWVNVRTKHVEDPRYQASYNYSETILNGLGAHEFRDVDPHVAMQLPYQDPPSFQKIESRRFPAKDRKGRPLAGTT